MSRRKKLAIGFDDERMRQHWELMKAAQIAYARCRSKGMTVTEFAEHTLKVMYDIMREPGVVSDECLINSVMSKLVLNARELGLSVRWHLPE
jgi:hypothetical protein